ncbi:MAG: trypsin-like peptidase domain-containing protein [Planctomycetota bacterium]|nr:trypsin-like peptidase domain-containing protein [Planctomycetota bacterium]MDA1137868.1 trypsin-like peptidase domain-containing protein [Planctomycetota bacterium]
MHQVILASLGILFPATTLCADISEAVKKAEQDRIEVIKKVSPAVVAVMAKGGGGGGSGIIISPDGYALTNFHVTSGAGDEMKCGLPDGKLYDAVIVGIDPSGDVSVIKLEGRDDFAFAALGDSDNLQVGEWALAMGNPFLLATDFTPTVTFGIISGLHRYQYPAGKGLLEYPDCIQVDASINPGNSGGPLFNMNGEIIGINGRISFEKRIRVNSGFGYAISSNQIKKFLYALKGGRVVDHATMGATVGTDEHGRVIVREVLVDADAYRRGIRIDDEIVELAGKKITTVNEFKNVLGTLPANWRVKVVLHRGTDKIESMVRLSGVHGQNWDFPTGGNKPSQIPRNIPKLKDQELKKPEDGEDESPPEEEEGELEEQPAEEKSEEKPKSEFAKQIQKQPGFSNYLFNLKEQKRVLEAFAQYRTKTDSALTWKIEGKAGRAPFNLQMNDDAGNMKIADMDFIVDKQALWGPSGDDGTAMLRALMYWRSFLLTGERAFQSCHYDGRAPTPFGECDLLVCSKGAIVIHWYFEPNTGALRMMEVAFDSFSDPYEILFGPYAPASDALLPSFFLVRVGDESIGKFDLGKVSMGTQEQKN